MLFENKKQGNVSCFVVALLVVAVFACLSQERSVLVASPGLLSLELGFSLSEFTVVIPRGARRTQRAVEFEAKEPGVMLVLAFSGVI